MKRFLLLFALAAASTMAALTPSVILKWTDPGNMAGTTWTLYRNAGACTTAFNIATATTVSSGIALSTLTYTDSGVAFGQTYCYGIVAVLNGLQSTVTQVTVPVCPLAPTNFLFTLSAQ